MDSLKSKTHILTILILIIGIGTVLQSCDQTSGIMFSDNDEQGLESVEVHSVAISALPSLKSNNTLAFDRDRKSTRLNSSHVAISYAVFCLKQQTESRGRSPSW